MKILGKWWFYLIILLGIIIILLEFIFGFGFYTVGTEECTFNLEKGGYEVKIAKIFGSYSIDLLGGRHMRRLVALWESEDKKIIEDDCQIRLATEERLITSEDSPARILYPKKYIIKCKPIYLRTPHPYGKYEPIWENDYVSGCGEKGIEYNESEIIRYGYILPDEIFERIRLEKTN